jgi:hypothetical protein
MSNSLILRPTGEMTETQAAMLAEMDAEGLAGFTFKPLKISLPLGGGTSAFTLSDGDMLKAPAKMIVAVAQRKRSYYPGKDVSNVPPLCASADDVTGRFDPNSEQVKLALASPVRHPALGTLDPARAIGPWQCIACPLAQWESSADGGRGQACKVRRALLVIVQGWSMPAILSLPPASVKFWDTFASGMRQRGQAYFSRWLEIGLNKATNPKGTPYAHITIKMDAPLTDPEAAEVMQIRAMYGELVRTMNLDGDEYVDAEQASNLDGQTVDSVADEETPPF